MVFVFFFIAAVVTVIAATKLSSYSDIISEKSSLGGMMVGTLLLAGATSLPEVTTSLTAVFLDNPDIAVGNVLGSNLFNILIIAVFDIFYRRRRLFNRVSPGHTYTAGLGALLAFVTGAAFLLQLSWNIFGVGVDALALLIFYAVGIVWANRQNEGVIPDEEEEEVPKPNLSLRQAGIGFIIAALFTLAAGTVLTTTGDQIAVITGLGSSFIGSFLIAASTSLPEAVSVYVAMKLKNYNLALGSILGSNLFNLTLLALSDIFYRGEPIISAASRTNLVTSLGITLLAAIVFYAVLRGSKRKTPAFYLWPSITLVIVYFIASYLTFIGLGAEW
ncbi:cation transporter [Marinococcus halophilus]|uniref:Sodium/calcium exchanger membrane protein n=1 Tax=Marinococcus halophilus TaxID=1371 RepID=A0A510Y3T8_MARHA|nr:sodium:calcium antiporter [Marinococcus halophilus]OZT80087.1 cation transporter [Marinococcus halophilus]GEK57988.1 sodium/calcium exchanger membrane protein [Marinococcus halophilus]